MKGAGGGKRRGRKPTNVEPDDRPRGYETTRMRQLWRDIDHAKRKAGLDPTPEPAPAPGWDLAGVLERAAALAGDAAAWVTVNAPAACALIASGAELLRGVPVIGGLVPFASPDPAERRGPAAAADDSANGHGQTAGGAVPVEPDDGGPAGRWIH
jgi:hypothetical protein